jgi:hypothetical protein
VDWGVTPGNLVTKALTSTVPALRHVVVAGAQSVGESAVEDTIALDELAGRRCAYTAPSLAPGPARVDDHERLLT